MKLDKILTGSILLLGMGANAQTSNTIYLPAGRIEDYNFQSGVKYIGAKDPRPVNSLREITDLHSPDDYTIIGQGTSFGNNQIEDIVFEAIYEGDTLGIFGSNVKVKDCLFIGDNLSSPSLNTRALNGVGLGNTAQYANGLEINGCIFKGYKRGIEMTNDTAKIRNTIFYDNEWGAVISTDADFGTEEDAGENIFYGNKSGIVDIVQGEEVRIQWGYFYDANGNQLKTEQEVLENLRDRRPNRKSLTVGSGVYIIPLHTEPNSLIEESTYIKDWNSYK